MKNLSNKAHLLVSAGIVIVVSFIYGFNPSKILPMFFDFKVDVLELKNIFRAIMGLYIAFASYWVLGALKSKYWEAAVATNILFMGGLAAGRIISTLVDGVSIQYTQGLLAELLLMIWGIYNIKYNFKNEK